MALALRKVDNEAYPSKVANVGEDEIVKFQAEISVHSSSINILLATANV